MKKIFTVIFLSNCTLFFSQAKSDWGSIITSQDSKSKHMWITAEDSAQVYLIKRSYFLAQTTWFLEAINKKTKGVVFFKTLSPPLDENNKKTMLRDVICLGNNLYMLSTVYQNDKNEQVLYASRLNKLTGFKEESKVIYRVIDKNSDKKILSELSPDGKSILIYSWPYNGSTDEMKLMNENFEKQWADRLVIAGSDKKIKLGVDNTGNIISYSPSDELLTLYSTTSKEYKIFSVIVPKGLVNYNSLFRFLPNGDGFFLSMLKPEKYEVTCGLINSFIDMKNQKIISTKTVFFDSTQIKELLGKNIGPKWKEIGTYDIKDVFFRSNDLILIGEQSFARKIYYSIFFNGLYPSSTSFLYFDYYNSAFSDQIIEYKSNLIAVFNLSYGGETNWIKTIPKSQVHPDYNYLSYIANYSEKGVYLIYNDNFSNINQKQEYGPKALDDPRYGVGVAAFVDNNGQLKLDGFYRRKQNFKFVIKPGLSYRGNNTISIFTENKNKCNIGELFFP